MIKVTVELIPASNPNKPELLGAALIYNDATSPDSSIGNYKCRLSKWAPKERETWKSGELKNFDRINRGPWDLLYLCLKNIVGDRNP